MKHALVTGGAGFIGSHLVDSLLRDGWRVTSIDNFDLFYPRAAKQSNIAHHLTFPQFVFHEIDIRDISALRDRIVDSIDVIVHLAAKAGVRPSIEDPITYQSVNVHGTQNLLELARCRGVRQFVFASSSSVYGVNSNVPWREDDSVLLPISPYAATKVSGELLGHVYSHLYGIRFIALRFFTVYGPRQRPDLAIHKFTTLMREGNPIPIYGDGATRRDYTFVDDIIRGIRSALLYDASRFEVFNLGNAEPVGLNQLIAELESVLGCRAIIQTLPDQPGDVPQTFADIGKARRYLDFSPTTSLHDGLEHFAAWLRQSDYRPASKVIGS